jgi:hypothetical protein
LFFSYRKAGGKVGTTEREGCERQIHRMLGSGMKRQENIFWRQRRRRSDTLKRDE